MKELSSLKRLAEERSEKEHTAIKIDYVGSLSSSEGPVYTYLSSDRITTRFNTLMREITVPLPDKYDLFLIAFDDLMDMAKAKGMNAVAAHDIIAASRQQVWDALSDQDRFSNYKAELAEIIDHFNTLMKAKAVQAAHEQTETIKAVVAKARAEALAQIKAA